MQLAAPPVLKDPGYFGVICRDVFWARFTNIARFGSFSCKDFTFNVTFSVSLRYIPRVQNLIVSALNLRQARLQNPDFFPLFEY